MHPALIAAAALAAFLALLRFLEATGFLWREDPRYPPPDESRLFDPRAASISIPAAGGGSDRAVLFVHGFPESPAAYADPCAWAAAAGFAASCPLLPGCGTEPRDILPTNFSQYLARVRDEYLALRARHREVFVAGTSMGGLIALALAEEACAGAFPPPEAMAVVCPPMFLNRLRLGVAMYPLAWFARTAGVFVKSIGAGLPDPGREGRDGDARWVGYLGLYPRQTYSIMRAGRRIEAGLAGMKVPLQLFGCRTDRMAPYACVETVARKAGSRDIRTYTANMEGQRHMMHSLLMYDSQRDRVWALMRSFFEEYSGGGKRGR